MSSFVTKFWLNWQILVTFLMNFIDKDRTTKVYIPVHPWFSFSRCLTILFFLLVYVDSCKQTTVRQIWTQNSLLFFLMFVSILSINYSSFEICRHTRFSFACYGAKWYGTVLLRTSVNMAQIGTKMDRTCMNSQLFPSKNQTITITVRYRRSFVNVALDSLVRNGHGNTPL